MNDCSRFVRKAGIRGFTLAELLIALAILGEIATFTIPKILSAQQSGQRKTIFRETFATISALNYQGVITGNVTSGTTFWAYMKSNLNAIKYCENAQTEGCWSGSSDEPFNTPTAAGAVLHNGALLTDIEFGSTNEAFDIDWNGTAGPNLKCVDQIPFVVYFTNTTRDGLPGMAGQVRYAMTPTLTASWGCPESTYNEL
jgi:prepilin-type N-terminal cleavage/methylation domain-containing protein